MLRAGLKSESGVDDRHFESLTVDEDGVLHAAKLNRLLLRARDPRREQDEQSSG